MPYDNTNKIAIFRNNKGDNAKRPDYRGTLNIDGVEYKCSLWLREKKDGSGMKYMQGSVERAKEADARAGDTPRATQAQQPAQTDSATDDVPF